MANHRNNPFISSNMRSLNYYRTGNATSWIVVALICLAVLAYGYSARSAGRVSPDADAVRTDLLPRTRLLAQQKQHSLTKYNKEITLVELLDFYRQHTNHRLSADAFAKLDELMLSEVTRKLWLESGTVGNDDSPILHHAMTAAIQKYFPHTTLTNADVILFPDDSQLRVIVSEPASDYFRDTARHWRWIENFVEQMDGEQLNDLKELDIYAAEELSEFLSVLAVGAVEMAAEKSQDLEIDPSEISAVFQRLTKYSPDVTVPVKSEVGFSQPTKDRLLESISEPMMVDATEKLGIDFVHQPNPMNLELRAKLSVPVGLEGGGVSAGDYNNDGYTDLYFAGDQGGALFRNIDGQRFDNVSKMAGLSDEGETRAGYFVDFNNDGDLDMFFTLVGQPNRLLENDGSGTFNNVSSAVGLLNDAFASHEAVWFDMNNDGLLDLYVANFGNWMAGDSPTIGRINANAPPNQLYKHVYEDDKHSFVEVGEAMGVDDRGWTHCVGAHDFDQDGWADLFSINDFGTSFVYRNLQGEGFEEVSRQLHLDDIYNGMSFTLLDLNHDSHFSIYISQIMKLTHRQRYSRPTEQTAIQFDPTKKENLRILVDNRLFTKAFETSFRDDHNDLIEPANLGWAWGVNGMDYENDSDLDLLVVNGTESAIPVDNKIRNLKYIRGRNFLAKFNYEQNVFFVQQDGYFYDVSAKNPIAFFGNSRGAAALDFDNDGDLDVAVSNYDSPPRVFENLQQSENSWIRIQLEGVKSNRNAIGATVEMVFDGQSRFGVVVSGTGFLSQDPYTLHFGLGNAKEIEKVVIRWPSGIVQTEKQLPLNRSHVIREQRSQ